MYTKELSKVETHNAEEMHKGGNGTITKYFDLPAGKAPPLPGS